MTDGKALRVGDGPLSIGAHMPWRIPTFEELGERRAGIFVVLLGLALYIPFAGSFGLYDPWETHYSEVARQMTVRGDYISLWWPGAPIDPDHFWSKPVLSFWIMSLSFHLFGLGHPGPGVMALSTMSCGSATSTNRPAAR